MYRPPDNPYLVKAAVIDADDFSFLLCSSHSAILADSSDEPDFLFPILEGC